MSTKQEQFVQDLVQFYRNRGVNNVHAKQFIVRLNGKVVNLSELYSLVLEYGGSYKVNQGNFWDEIYCKLFKSSNIGANFAVALRQVYNRYLLQYEKTSSGQNFTNTEQWNEDEDEENIFSSTNQHSNSLATLFTNSQDLNNVTDSLGQVHNDSKLYCSLLSGLPNELNFAFNVATILSNCNRFDWTNDYKFINVLLESVKSYCCVCDQFEEDIAFGRSSLTEEDNDEIVLFKKFLHSSITSSTSSSISNDDCNGNISESGSSFEETTATTTPLPSCPKKKAIEYVDKRCNCYGQFWSRMCLDEEALRRILDDDIDVDFALPFVFKDLPVHLMKKIEQRIELIGGIILNISVTYDQNSDNHVSMMPLLKFLTLLLRSENTSYLNLSLDILANIAPSLSSYIPSKMNQKLYHYLLDVLLRGVVQLATESNNLHFTTKSFEILARYISCMNNEANHFLETYFENVKLSERITQLLTCQYDIALLLALLEFCLILSEARPFLLVQNENKNLIKILINLLNCEANSHFTTSAFKKVKVVDDRPKQQEMAHSTVPNLLQHNGNITVVSQGSKGGKPTIINSLAVSNVAQNVLDNESFAISWLRMTYEDAPGCSFKVSDIYAEYLKHCCRNSRKNVIATQSFSFLIKRCFPSCNLNATQTIVEGLAVKGALVANAAELQQRQTSSCGTVVSQHPQLMSPILKAHLSTPPKNNAALQGAPGSPVPSDQTPATTNTSTLIKSLLANKLRSNQTVVSSPNPPIIGNNVKPIGTQVTTQPLINSNDAKDLNSQKNVVFVSNPATTFAITPTTTFANNIIMPNANMQQQQQHLQGTQQILVVRTILAGPGQQNPVRLILPASMLTQQRLPAPVGSNMNGLVMTGNNVMQAISAQAPQQMQTQMTVPTSQMATISSANNIVVNSNNIQAAAVAAAASPQPVQNRNSIATSSPLLNVLLDKGKLPDFPSTQNPTTVVVTSNASIPNASATINTTSTVTSINQTNQQQQQQPKMYILTTTSSKQSAQSNCLSNSTATTNDTATASIPVSNSGNVASIVNNEEKTTPLLPNTSTTTTPMVNGDLKPIVANNTLIKHALENSTEEVSKRLKTSNAPNNSDGTAVVTDNGLDTNSSNGSTNQNSHLTASESKPISNGGTSAADVMETTVMDNGSTTIDLPTEFSNANVASATPNEDSNEHVQAAANPPGDANSTTQPASTNAVPTTTSAAASSANVEAASLDFECQWNDCQMKFAKASEVFYHVHTLHIMTESCPSIMNCLWGGPEGKGPGCLSKRPKLSLLTHLQDFHCNPTVLKQELLRKRQLSLMGSTSVVLPQPPAHPGYAQNAAMLAIRRHATNYVENAIAAANAGPPPSPLTVSIRLTSALILRNLAQRSHLVKKSLELFESQLCEISIAEGRDESRTIAQCLAVITDQV